MSFTLDLTKIKRLRPQIAGVFSILAFSFLALDSPAMAQSEQAEGSGSINSPEGSWIIKIDRLSVGDSFTALMSFTTGGVTVATGSLDKLNPISPLYGSWKQTGRNRVAVTLYFFLFDPIGNPMGTVKTNETFHLNGQNQLTGSGSSFVCDVDGENCSNHGTEALTRITGRRILAEGVKE